jgi:hypothetical protein
MLIALMMKAAGTSETSVDFYETSRRNFPEGSHLYVSFILTRGSDSTKYYTLLKHSINRKK